MKQAIKEDALKMLTPLIRFLEWEESGGDSHHWRLLVYLLTKSKEQQETFDFKR